MSVEIKPGFGRERLPIELVIAGMMIGAEIGVQSGLHAADLLSAGVSRLYLVDLWAQQPNYFDIANVHDAHHLNNLKETIQQISAYPFRCTILHGPSDKMAERIRDVNLDFIYIDANHNLESVRSDLAAWVPKVRPGGWVCGHDFLTSSNCCGSEFGVEQAVLECCERMGVTELFVCPSESFPNWHFVKP